MPVKEDMISNKESYVILDLHDMILFLGWDIYAKVYLEVSAIMVVDRSLR